MYSTAATAMLARPLGVVKNSADLHSSSSRAEGQCVPHTVCGGVSQWQGQAVCDAVSATVGGVGTSTSNVALSEHDR